MTTHIHKAKGTIPYTNAGFIYCQPDEIVDLNLSNSTPSQNKATCINCAMALGKELMKRGKVLKLAELCIRFKLTPGDFL